MTDKKRRRIVILIVLTILAGAASGLHVSEIRAEETAIEQAKTVLMDNAREQAGTMSVMFESSFRYLELLADSTAYETGRTPQETEEMLLQLEEHGGFGVAFIVGLDGAAEYGENAGCDYSDEAFFRTAVGGGRAMDAVEQGAYTGKACIVLAVPYYVSGEITGALCGMYREAELVDTLTSEVYQGSGYSYIADSSGRIIVNTAEGNFLPSGWSLLNFFDDPAISYESKEAKQALRQAITGRETAAVYYSLDGDARIISVLPFGGEGIPENDWLLCSVVARGELTDQIEAQSANAIEVVAVIIAFSLAALFLFLLLERDNKVKLAKAGRLKEELLDHLPCGAAIFRADGEVIRPDYLNARYYEMVGRSGDKIEKLDVMKVVHPDDVQKLYAQLNASARNDWDSMCEVRIMTGSGEYKPFRVIGHFAPESGGGRSCYCLYFPIDEGVFRAIREKENTETRYRGLVDNSGGGLTVTEILDSGEAVNIFSSDGMLRLMHTTRARWDARRGADIYAKVYPDDVEKARDIFDRLRENGEDRSAAYRLKCADGGYTWVNVSARYFEEDGRGYIYAVHTDITQQRESQQKEHDARKRLESVMSSITCGVCAYGYSEAEHRSSILFANQSYYSMFGYTREQFEREITDTFSYVYPGDIEKLDKAIQEAMDTGETMRLEYRCIKRGGGLMWVSVNFALTRIFGTQQAVLLCETVDITERRRSEEEKQAMLEQISFLNRAAGDLFSDADADVSIRVVLQDILDYFSGGRAYIFEFEPEKAVARNTYEVCAPGVEPAIELLRCVPYAAFGAWFELFEKDGYITISDIDRLGPERAEERALLEAQHISSLLVVPLRKNGRLTGMMGVDDPDRNYDQMDRLQAIGDYITIMLERRDQTAALQDSNLRMNIMMSDTPGGFVQMVIHPDSSVTPIFFNDGFCRMMGMTQQQAMARFGMDAYSGVHPDDCGPVAERLTEIMGSRSTLSTRVRIQNQEGQYVPLAADYRVWESPDGELFLNGYYRDISEQTALEENYRRNMSYRNIIIGNAFASYHLNVTRNIMDDGASSEPEILALDTDGTISGFVKNISAMHRDADVYREFASRFTRGALLTALARGKSQVSYEHPLYVSPGRALWVCSVAELFKNPDTGDAEGFLYARDLTTEHTLSQIMSTVVNVSYDFIVLISIETGAYRTFLSDAGISTAFMERGVYDEATFRKLMAIIHPDDRAAVLEQLRIPAMRRRLEGKSSAEFHCRVVLNGEVRNKKYSFAYLDETQESVILSRIDETETVGRMQALLDEADKASAAKSEFLSHMSHEIRTPMNAIIGMTQLARYTAETDGQTTAEYLREIDDSSQYLLSIINDILDMSRIESGSFRLNCQWVGMAEVLDPCYEIIRPAMEKRHINFITPAQPGMEGTGAFEYYLDAMKVRQLLLNLLNNACKFTEEGGTISFRWENISSDGESALDRLIVEDSGCGMSEGFLEQVFMPFEQEKNRYTDSVQGTGLGLTIAKRIAAAMGGDITVESRLNVGSKFTVTLPYSCRPASGQAAPAAAEAADDGALCGARVLLAEDNAINAKIARKLLEKKGVETVWARDGAQALKLFGGSEPGDYDAVLMDIRMPELDGLEAAKAIRAMDRPDASSVPIIAMSANAFTEDVQKSLNAGMNAHLSKPIDPQQLYRTLAEQIHREKRESR